MKLQYWKRWFWPGLSGALALALVWTLWTNHLLRENVALYKRVVTVQEEWCQGVQGVNDLCEATIVDIGARLGLDTEWMPLVTTALWRRASGGVSIKRARAGLGAPSWQKHGPLSGGFGDDGEVPTGIGGGTEADERAPAKPRVKRRK